MKLIKQTVTCTILILMAAIFSLEGTAAAAGGEVLSGTQTPSERTKKEVTLPKNADSAKIQELLNENKNGEYDLIIYVPEGTYRLEHELKIYSNTTIEADPKAVFQKMHRRGALLANDLTKDQGGFSASSNITVSGGLWDSKSVADDTKGTESFRFIHAQNITVKNAVICNVPESSHLITFAGVKQGTVEGCTLYGYHGTRPKEAIQIDIVHDDVVVPSMQAEFIKYDDQACEDILIRNNEIYDFPRAVGSHTSVQGVFHSGIQLTGNRMHDLLEAGVKAYNYINSEISQNTISNAGVGILVYTAIDGEEDHYFKPLSGTEQQPLPEDYHIRISDNTISETEIVKDKKITFWGDGIRILGSKERPISGVEIGNNTITGAQRYGIFAEQAPACQVKENQISATAKNGIYLINACDGSEITQNTITQPGTSKNYEEKEADGIGLLASKNVAIHENTIQTPARNGIFIYDSCTKTTVTGNTSDSAGENGIAVYQKSNDVTVTENTIKNSKKHGIFFYETGSGTITSNKISVPKGSTGQDGIHIAAESDADRSFILKKNTISRAGRFGIYLNNAPKCQISGNKISNTADHALYLDKGSNQGSITWNRITNAGKKGSKSGGIGINGSEKVKISKNTVKNAAKNGIFLYQQSKNCTVSSNTITAFGKNAISVNSQSNGAALTGNIITGSSQEISADKNSKERGIFVYESDKVKITKNKIIGCPAKQEIVLSKSSGSTKQDNTIQKTP